MRTTVTLDPDVERLIKDAMRERGISFKEALNEAARGGLRAPMGGEQLFRWDKALSVADAIEDEERVREFSMGKCGS